MPSAAASFFTPIASPRYNPRYSLLPLFLPAKPASGTSIFNPVNAIRSHIYKRMIKFKHLINEVHDANTLKAKDIFNFYYLWHAAVNDPASVNTPFGKEVLNYYLGQFKTKYVNLFSKLMAKQIQKYAERKRHDPDFQMPQNLEGQSPDALLALIKKTFRTDMQRRNDKWEMVGEFVVNLAKASRPKDIFVWINQLNNAVHNTQAKVMDKFPNYYTELNGAFDVLAKSKNIEMLKNFVDKDIRDLKNQEGPTNPADYPKDYDRDQMSEGLEKIVMNPDALSKLKGPAAPPSSFATNQSPIVKKKGEKDDLDKDAPPELKLSALENVEIDTAFYGNKKVSDQTPAPKPMFKPLIKKKEDEKDPKNKTDHFKLGSLQEALDTGEVSTNDKDNIAFMSGLKIGVQDKNSGRKRNLKSYPPDFARGYNMVKREGWWNRFNDKLTSWASSIGHSFKP